MPIYKNILLPFVITLLILFVSFISNISFRIMGYDFGSELLSYINSDFINKLVLLYGKITLIYFLYFSLLSEMISMIFKEKKLILKYYLITISIFLLLPFLSSITMHPQLYADFFYMKHPAFLPILYFLTEYGNPYIYTYILYAILLIYIVYLIFLTFYKQDYQKFILLCYITLFILFHLKGEIIGVLLSYFFYKILVSLNIKIKNRYALFVSMLMIIFSIFIFYFENKFYYTSLDSEKKPSIFIISADSLRKDKIGEKINGISITPNIDTFVVDSINYKDHITTIPRTFPSWVDLLTGTYSMEHKVRDMFPDLSESNNIGSEKFPTLAQILNNQGYETSVFSNFAGDIFPRADFGFKTVKTPTFNAEVILVQKNLEPQIFLLPILTGTLGGGGYFKEINSFSNLGDGKFILDDILPYLRLNGDKSLFSTIFFSVTHFPYSPPYPFYKYYSDPSYFGKYKYFKFVDPTDDAKPTEKDISEIKALFEESITSFDSDFGKLINQLKLIKKYDSSIIILTGDHGESIYEDVHGHGHGEHLRGEHVIPIPLYIKYPKDFTLELKNKCEKCSSFEGITSSIDLFPTVMDYLKITTNREYPGTSLLSVLGKTNWDYERMVYSETGIWFSDMGDHFFQKQRIMYPNILKLHRVVPENNSQIMITDPFYRDSIAFAKHRAILSSKYKFIYIPTHDGVVYEMYNRTTDPLNTKNLYPQQSIEMHRNFLYSQVKKWENSKIISEYILPPPIEE
jgi:arylsulfatase A-like enzyme